MPYGDRIWRALLLINVLAPLAAAIVLFLWPAAIPAVVGIRINREQYLLPYLLASGELAFACLCALALTRPALRQPAAWVGITFHASAGVATVLAWLLGAETAILANTAVRIVMVALFAMVGLKARA